MKKLTKNIKRIGLVANSDKVACKSAIRRAVNLIEKHGRLVFADQITGQMAKLPEEARFQSVSRLATQVDLILVFGGDGTMLKVARDIAGAKTPLLGVNLGRLGFLTDVDSKELPQALKMVWNHNYTLEPRPLIEAIMEVDGKTTRQTAMNDFVISRGLVSRMIELEVSVDDKELTRYRCDGLIVSTPTGSTAYALSAGGAIVSPMAEVISLTPICPQALSNRSVIVSLRSILKVTILSQKLEIILTADGQVPTQLKAGDMITIRRSRRIVHLLRLAQSSFFATLRQKLHWSGSNV